MNAFKDRIVHFSVNHYKGVTIIMVLFTLACGAFIPMIKVDTDPENMLSADEPVRVFHDETKKEFDLSDIVVLGIINEDHEYGVFNPQTLGRIYELTEYAKTLNHLDKDNPAAIAGVIEADMIAPSMVDHIGQGGPGVIKFEWLMPRPPKTQEEALEIRNKVLNNPLFRGTMVSEDGRAICVYLPLTAKHYSYQVYTKLNEKIAGFTGDDQFHITGLPVAEDTFGVEMFIQMAISAPLAMLTIFILMLLFFRKLVLVISPMVIAMVSVISTMGLLIGFGYPVHIMSSMIPIFLMPIAVVDSVHILSEFFDVYTKEKGRRDAIEEVMHTLFTPMLYTSLTSAAGFLSLALTPIPPVQVFGVFVATGIMIAWVFTVTFVPAYVMLIPEKRLENFGMAVHHEDKASTLTRILHAAGGLTHRYAKSILVLLVILTIAAVWGITKIRINDNPVKWFSKSHPIRRADIALNDHFGGTYMAYLVLDAEVELHEYTQESFSNDLLEYLQIKAQSIQEEYPKAPIVVQEIKSLMNTINLDAFNRTAYTKRLKDLTEKQLDAVPQNDDDLFYAWSEMIGYFDSFDAGFEEPEPFKDPDTLKYIAGLQKHLEDSGLVGKSNSLADVVKKVHQELIDGSAANFRVPDTKAMVSECLIQYQQSHRPQDLWHFATPNFTRDNVWMQLTSGVNKDMESVVRAVDAYFDEHIPPIAMTHEWAGLTYINTVWQNKMVWGMLQSFLGSFLVVFIMMSVLFRSPLWGLLCMVPLTITIAAIYGAIGFIGKDYDMPVAVLSALTLGMAVDFAIHFLERGRAAYAAAGSWQRGAGEMFGEPARAIARNVLVIAIGFLPLLAAPLVPYKTVGVFLCAIMAVSGIITLLTLPAALSVGERWFFKKAKKPESVSCNCGFCIVIAIATVAVILLNLYQNFHFRLTTLTWISAGAIPVMLLICGILSRRKACKMMDEKKEDTK